MILWCRVTNVSIVSWEPEGCDYYSKIFLWEPEGRYHHTFCTTIAPFWFSTEHLWILIVPFWLSTEYIVVYRSNLYKKLKDQSRTVCRKAYNEFMKNVISPDAKCNPKRFWAYINSRRCDSHGVHPLKSSDGVTYTDSTAKANILNKQFSSVFTDESLINVPEKGPCPYPSTDSITVSPAGVKKLLEGLNIHKSPGPDGIPSRLLKTLATELTPILTILFQATLHHGTIPLDWKKANVTAIFKSGERNKASNYRPISLTSITCKILEHIICSQIMSHFDRNNILTDAQHGFRKRRSCITQLIISTHELLTGIDKGEQHNAILLDFSKAFDKVPHHRLLRKLQYYGIHNQTFNWIQDFLTDRTQRVVLEGCTSETANVTSGVPQGSVIGPLLFLIYINDLPDSVSPATSTKLFADDCLLYRNIKTVEDARNLQNDLDALQRWEADWLMEFNPKKCKILTVTNKRNPLQHTYQIHNEALEEVPTAKYLGISLHQNMKWNHHVNQLSTKANSTRAFLQRNIRSCPRHIKIMCYKTLLRPVLEYGCEVWDPSTQMLRQRLEMVQRRYVRFIFNDFKNSSSVSDMLHKLHLPTLEERRAQYKAIMMHRIVNSAVDIPKPNYLIPVTRSSLRGHDQKFHVPFARTQAFQTSFFPDTIRMWNSLPNSALCTSAQQFKEEVQKIQLR